MIRVFVLGIFTGLVLFSSLAFACREELQKELQENFILEEVLDNDAYLRRNITGKKLLTPEEERRIFATIEFLKDEVYEEVLSTPEGRVLLWHFLRKVIRELEVPTQENFSHYFYGDYSNATTEDYRTTLQKHSEKGPLKWAPRRAVQALKELSLSREGRKELTESLIVLLPDRKKLERLEEALDERRERIILANTKLAMKVAHKAVRNPEVLFDLFADGLMGLIRAVDRFDPNKKKRFSTYAYVAIERAIERTQSQGIEAFYIPVNVRTDLFIMKRAETELTTELERVPEKEEVIDRFSLLQSRRELRNKLKRDPTEQELQARYEKTSNSEKLRAQEIFEIYHLHTTWIDQIFYEGRDMFSSKLEAKNANDDPFSKSDLRDIRSELQTAFILYLNPHERKVLSVLFGFLDGEEHSYESTGRALGLSKEYVRSLRNSAIKKFRSAFITKNLRYFIEEK